MRKSWSIFISLLLVFVLSGCGGGDANRISSAGHSPSNSSAHGSDTIKIGGLFSVSGGASTLGKPQMDTLKMLVEEANA
ncbi:ABC transporter substrate-binding protein, partial [Paenibacillus thiaminolyticus]|nr:ABC transporter substrate-binding protein [Paenibacillus thiaminolyticus]